MNKKVLIIISAIIIFIIGFKFLKKEEPSIVPTIMNLNEFSIDNEKIKLNKGDRLYADAWNLTDSKVEVLVNDEEYDEFPIIYGGITIGSTVKEVFETFKIKKGYAKINMEVPDPEYPGDTNIKDIVYEDFSFLEKNFLDVLIIFGYKKENNKWNMMEYSETRKYTSGEKEIDGDILIYRIDINGMLGEAIPLNHVISIEIEYLEKGNLNKWN